MVALLSKTPSNVQPFVWRGSQQQGHLEILNQVELPWQEQWMQAFESKDIAMAIEKMWVRGAPAIGICAAFGMFLAARGCEQDAPSFVRHMQRAKQVLDATRPTAVNLTWATAQMLKLSERLADDPLRNHRLFEQVDTIWRHDAKMCDQIAQHGAPLFADGARILTHCNTGALATGGRGTALGIIREVHDRSLRAGKRIHVWVDETRPYLQGSRLTTWELEKDDIDCTLITDNMAAHFMQAEHVDGIVVGADRIAANGDTANKIGTYNLAVLAKYHQIPFYIAAPSSSIDPKCKSQKSIVIEQRSSDSVKRIRGIEICSPTVRAAYPAFDVSPHELITAIITEHGVHEPPYDFVQ